MRSRAVSDATLTDTSWSLHAEMRAWIASLATPPMCLKVRARGTIEDATRINKSRNVDAYLGLRPRQRQSGLRDPELRITKAGDRDLRRLLVQCAHQILGPFGKDSDLRRWGLELAKRGGATAKKKAVIAVARKLSVLLHRLWLTGEVYEPLRNANRRETKNKQASPAMAI